MNLLTYNHSIASLFILSGRLYQKNIIPILILTSVIIAPAFLLGFAGFSEVESIVFFLSVRVLEAAVTLGIIGTAFGSYFPSLGILRVFRSIILLGTIHVAILQYLLFITGVMGLTLPFPLNIVVIAFWLGGLLLTSMSQPVFIVEGTRGIRALIRSIQLARGDLSRVFFVVVISTILQFIVFAVFFTLFMPDFNLDVEHTQNSSLPILMSEILNDPQVHLAIRWSQYLASLLFYPFASLVTCFLYFDLARRQQSLNVDKLAQFSNQMFGTPLSANEEAEMGENEEIIEPSKVEVIDPETADTNKDK
ncbi:MAG: hypothetical protein MAG581_01686 [Deltaproteobacteria bacterium]|nr:hypothetical protein [Deltaproteobacteria bacterium]